MASGAMGSGAMGMKTEEEEKGADVGQIQQIVDATRVTQSVLMRQKGNQGRDPTDSYRQAQQQVMKLFENGHGCNLTLFNPHVLREADLEDEDPNQINNQLASGLNNSASSFGEHHREQVRNKAGKLAKAGRSSLRLTSGSSKADKTTDGGKTNKQSEGAKQD